MSRFIIPMKVEAFVKSNSYSEDERISIAIPNYRDAVDVSFLGSYHTPQPFNKDGKPLGSGVHLHFILPDAFTHADETDEYPAVPDRFLITRMFVGRENAVKLKRFILESNFISDNPYYESSVTIPMFSDGIYGSMFRYLGRCYEEGNEPEIEGEYLEKLTVLGPGDPAFAAYYPSCHSVFGFYDDMKDVPKDTKVSYFVAGYFSNASQDLLSFVTEEKDFLEALHIFGFSTEITEKAEKKFYNSTVLFGVVAGIEWKGADYNYDKGIPKGEIDVAVGNTSAEALSAILSSKIPDGINERYITALQYSLLESGEEEDGNFKIDDGIHTSQFEAIRNPAGDISISVPDGNDVSGIGLEYSDLIKKKEKLAGQIQSLEWERQKLFGLWEQYMYLYERDSKEKNPTKGQMIAEIKRVSEDIRRRKEENDVLALQVEQLRENFTQKLPQGLTLKASGGEAFYRPKDPAVLLSGSGLNRSFAFGEDGRYTQDNTLFCQSKPLSCNIDTDALLSSLGMAADCSSTLAIADDYRGLLVQAILLSEDIKICMEQKLGHLDVVGVYSPIVINNKPQEFITLFMDWSVRFYPTRSSADGEKDNTFSDWEFNYGETVYTYDKPRSEEKNIVYTGRTVVIPHAVYNIKAALAKWLDKHPYDEGAEQAMQKIHELPVLSQSLGGFTEQMCALRQDLQFPIIGNEGEEEIAALVRELASECRVSSVPSDGVYSLRGGHFRIDRLNLLSTFGQTQNVIVSTASGGGMQKIHYAETVRSEDKDYGVLVPSFVTPSRLSFQWISCADNDCISSVDGLTTPVCGFLVPEILNRRLLVYSNDGIYLGTLKTVYRSGKTQARWLSAPTFPNELENINMDATLKAFLLSMKEDDAFAGLLKLSDGNFNKTLPVGTINLLWGRPLVLARASVRLISQGGFNYTKCYDDFGKYNTQGVENLKIPLHFGDAFRVMDGMVALFTDSVDEKGKQIPNFQKIYPSWGVEPFENTRIEFMECPEISFSGGVQRITVLMEAGSKLHIQTGVLPVQSVSLPEEHIKISGSLPVSAELTCVLTTKENPRLPVLQNGKTAAYDWCYRNKADEMIIESVAAPITDFAQSYICDGMLLYRKEEENE